MQERWAAVERLIGVKTARYSMVSVISVITTQIVLIIAAGAFGVAATLANVIAVSVGAVPSYGLNRAWTWGKTGKNHLFKEVIPFWAMAFIGLGLSTWFVAIADSVWGTTLAASIANLVAFGVLWVGKFFVLHLVLFKADAPVVDQLDDSPPVPAS